MTGNLGFVEAGLLWNKLEGQLLRKVVTEQHFLVEVHLALDGVPFLGVFVIAADAHLYGSWKEISAIRNSVQLTRLGFLEGILARAVRIRWRGVGNDGSIGSTRSSLVGWCIRWWLSTLSDAQLRSSVGLGAALGGSSRGALYRRRSRRMGRLGEPIHPT